MLDGKGAVVGSEGYYIDLTDTFDQARKQALDESLPELFEARAAIEQAKGALMLVYRISADLAFEILLWRSQQTNTKLRALAAQVVAELDTIRVSAGQFASGIRPFAAHRSRPDWHPSRPAVIDARTEVAANCTNGPIKARLWD